MNRDKYICWILLAATFLLVALLYGRVVIQNDGISYYALTISLLQDGDFDLTNQSHKFPEVRITRNPETGKIRSQYSCGFAVLYAPFVYASEILSRLSSDFASWRPYAQNVRFPFPHSLGIFTGSVLFGFLTVLSGITVLRRLYDASWIQATLLSVSTLIGGALMFYSFSCPSFAHAADAFLVSVAFLLVVLPGDSLRAAQRRNFLLGLTLALSVLLRNNNLVLVPLLVGGQFLFLKRRGIHRTFKSGLEIFLGALPILLIQVLFNLEQYGSIIATGYGLRRTTSLAQRFQRLIDLFIHPISGVFVNIPLILVVMAGWIVGMRDRRPEAYLSAACVITVLLSIAYAGYIYPGSAFGQRLVVHLYIFFLIGIYLFIRSFRTSGILLTILFVLWSFLLMNVYFVTTSQRGLRVGSRRGFDPFLMIEATVQVQRDSGLSFAELWYRSLSSGPYPTLHVILSRDPKPILKK